MQTQWTSKALSDLRRLHEFLARSDSRAATRVVRCLVAAPDILQSNPRIGHQLDTFLPREVRRIIVGQYELRYEITAGDIYILRIWHNRESR